MNTLLQLLSLLFLGSCDFPLEYTPTSNFSCPLFPSKSVLPPKGGLPYQLGLQWHLTYLKSKSHKFLCQGLSPQSESAALSVRTFSYTSFMFPILIHIVLGTKYVIKNIWWFTMLNNSLQGSVYSGFISSFLSPSSSVPSSVQRLPFGNTVHLS